jgi:hypothetical protein
VMFCTFMGRYDAIFARCFRMGSYRSLAHSQREVTRHPCRKTAGAELPTCTSASLAAGKMAHGQPIAQAAGNNQAADSHVSAARFARNCGAVESECAAMAGPISCELASIRRPAGARLNESCSYRPELRTVSTVS